MTGKQFSIIILAAFIGIVVLGIGLLAFGLRIISVRQDSNPNIELLHPVRGIITQIEEGKDGVQIGLQSDDLLYSVTIRAIQTEIIGGFDQIELGAEIEVFGQEISGMEPALIVAEQVTVLASSSHLLGEKWFLARYQDQNPISDHQPTLLFEVEQVSGNTGCNHYGGSYQVNGDGINFEGIESTEMACLDPEGLMQQERTYLELLSSATRFTLVDGVLTIFAGTNPVFIFEKQQVIPEVPTYTPAPSTPIASTATATVEVVDPTQSPVFEPPTGFKEYRDSVAGFSIYIPENWTITGVINGQYAIFQSYPEDKYAGGGARELGDTKCDLNIRPTGTRMTDLIQKWESDSSTTILSDREIILKSGLIGRGLVRESMGRSVTLVTEINNRAITLTCFGNPEPFEGIVQTLSGFDPEVYSPIYESAEGFKHYMDAETGVSVDVPGHWVAAGIIPGQRATLQSFPQDKYIGGEALERGDTKCDLFIRSELRVDEFIQQVKSSETVTIITEKPIVLNSDQSATRIEIESMGPSILVIAELNGNTVVLTCYGDFSLVDAIAATLDADG